MKTAIVLLLLSTSAAVAFDYTRIPAEIESKNIDTSQIQRIPSPHHNWAHSTPQTLVPTTYWDEHYGPLEPWPDKPWPPGVWHGDGRLQRR